VTQPETEAPAGATGATAGEDAAAKAPATTSNADTAAAPPAPEAPPAAAAAPPPPPSNGASAGEVRLKLFARTDVGQIREHNEDNFLVADLSKRSRGLLESNRVASVGPFGHLFAVCDGMGGAAAGEVASQLAVDIIYERMVDGLDQKTEIRRDDIARRLVRAVETAGFVDDHLFFAQVGDSRGYILRDGALTQVTRDQSLVNQLIEAGQLTAEEAETFEHNNIILQALGTSDTVQVDLTFVEVRPGDVMLLCSDGLSGMVRFDEIRETMRTAGEPVDVCKALTERANLAGGHDNITVIIVAFEGDGLKVASSGGDAEPLKYRKYSLPEEVAEGTERHRRPPPEPGSPAASQDKARASDRPLPADDALSAATGGPRSAKSRSDGWHEEGPHGSPANGDESIDIPGTHVPPGVVVAIVLGVVAVLAATALVLLR
jgi:serine/threonine protein phosphatase PrpC